MSAEAGYGSPLLQGSLETGMQGLGCFTMREEEMGGEGGLQPVNIAFSSCVVETCTHQLGCCTTRAEGEGWWWAGGGGEGMEKGEVCTQSIPPSAAVVITLKASHCKMVGTLTDVCKASEAHYDSRQPNWICCKCRARIAAHLCADAK